MTKHRKKTHYRKITIAAVAIGAMGIPTAAMACMDWRENDKGAQSYRQWKNTSAENRWADHDSSGKPSAQPASDASKAPAASPTASPSASKSATPSSSAPASGDTARVVELVNSERSKAGCSPVTVDEKLTKAAQDHSKDMAEHGTMSHTGSDGSDAGERITRAGYSWSTYGENVAYGYSTPAQVMEGWMSSPGHKRNILNCDYKEIGVGLAQPGSYWTQDFGTAR
ncbi:CAP domain-containing protein [Streptomyces pathocidini]|uniref:CAP domain-containing protein n=1 Tax=Streptomyces pathocidini TaxID=1650571 RepID=A0ABW7UUB3_9ACTN|nr:CAP domain-containing protein [Streptomyces pathocidini]